MYAQTAQNFLLHTHSKPRPWDAFQRFAALSCRRRKGAFTTCRPASGRSSPSQLKKRCSAFSLVIRGLSCRAASGCTVP